MGSEELRYALTDDGDSLQLVALPMWAQELMFEVDAPPRLAAHLRVVHDVAVQILAWIQDRYPTVVVNAPIVLAAAAVHDIGKVLYADELSVPGSRHEEGGYRLLIDRGIDTRVAELVRDHGNWGTDGPLELLLVSLADKVWKDKRQDDLEQLVVDRIAEATGEPPWAIFSVLDEQLSAVGSFAVQRLAHQNRYGTG